MSAPGRRSRPDFPEIPVHGRTSLDDDILMRRAADGDEHAFRLLVKRYNGEIYNYFLRSTGSVEDAEDLAQQCFVNLFGSLPRYRRTASLRTFLYRIANNLAVSFSRRAGPPASLDALLEAGYDPPDRGGGPEERAVAVQLRKAYLAALQRLPVEWRSVVELRAGRELSYREIADAIGKSEAAVESILFRARERLAKDLARYRPGGGGNQ